MPCGTDGLGGRNGSGYRKACRARRGLGGGGGDWNGRRYHAGHRVGRARFQFFVVIGLLIVVFGVQFELGADEFVGRFRVELVSERVVPAAILAGVDDFVRYDRLVDVGLDDRFDFGGRPSVGDRREYRWRSNQFVDLLKNRHERGGRCHQSARTLDSDWLDERR
jgi:hypothetical protein